MGIPGKMEKPDLGNALICLVRTYSSNEKLGVAPRHSDEVKLKNDFRESLIKHDTALRKLLLNGCSDIPDSHKQAACISCSVLDVYPLIELPPKKAEYYLMNELVALQLARYHIRVLLKSKYGKIPDLQIGTYPLIYDQNPYDLNFRFMLRREKELTYCEKHKTSQLSANQCEEDKCQWHPACRRIAGCNYLALSKLFYHYENDLIHMLEARNESASRQ